MEPKAEAPQETAQLAIARLGKDNSSATSEANLEVKVPEVSANFTVQVSAFQTEEEAEAYKKGDVSGEGDSVLPQEVERVVQNVAEWLAGEIQRSLDFYAATSADSRISRIYLSGGAANLPTLARVIARTSGVPAELVNPFRQISYDTRTFNEHFLESAAASAAVAVGLALRRTTEV